MKSDSQPISPPAAGPHTPLFLGRLIEIEELGRGKQCNFLLFKLGEMALFRKQEKV